MFFLIAFSLLNIGLFAQKKSFSSENIDSLLISYKTHQKNELSKAYVVDQIVRYYTNNKNYGEASKYNKEYLKLSIALNSKDLSNRYAFRNACLNYMLSDKKTLDTITCIKAYKYFKRRDHKLYSSISNQMVSYLRGKDGFGSKYMINSEQLIAWYLRSGEDNDRIGEFYYSATDYYNASLNISPKDVKRRESTCRKAIHSSKKSGNKHNIINVTYTLLTETYVENKKTAKTLALEQELIKLKNKNILNKFYGVIGYNNATHLMTKAGILAFKEKQKLVQEQLKQFRDSTLVINLPQGKYYYDVYEQSKINKRYSISIEGSQIHKSTITRSDTLHEIYNVHRSYSLKENIKLLSVKKLETMHKDELWQFILLTFSDEIVRLDDNPYWYNSELKQDSIMNELLQNKKEEIQNRFSEKGFERYYEKEKYKKLIALPSLNETNIQKLSKVFKQKRFSENELNEGYYQSFVYVGSNPRNKSDIKRRLDLEDLIIENGFQPFSSIAVYLESELNEKSNSAPTDYGGTIIFGLFIIFASLLTNPAALVILILLVLAVVYLLKYLKDKRMEKVQLEVIKPFTANKSKPEVTPQNSEQNTQEQDKFSEKITEKK